MKLKPIIPIVLMISAPIMGMGQNKSGLVMSNLDKTVKPADDFYQFATGGWQKNNPLPAAYSRYGSFDQLQENNSKRINTILSDLEKKKYATGTIEQKLSDFYKLALNVERRNTEGTAPVAALLNEIESASTVAQLRELQLKYAAQGYGVQYASYFGADSKNVSMNIMHISQSGLTLEQKDYYLNNDAATVPYARLSANTSPACSGSTVLTTPRPRRRATPCSVKRPSSPLSPRARPSCATPRPTTTR